MTAKEVVKCGADCLWRPIISAFFKYALISSLIVAIGSVGDRILTLKRTPLDSYLIAVSDTLIHGVIAFFSWLLVYVFKEQPIFEFMHISEAIICFFTASAIDLDHVIAAGGFNIDDITHLSHRPFLHNTTLTLLISLVIITMSLIHHNWMFYTYGWIFLTATFTHHLRDALRRGFWLYPFETKPVPYWTYILIMLSYPMVCSVVMDIVSKEWLQRHSNGFEFKYKTLNINVEDV